MCECVRSPRCLALKQRKSYFMLPVCETTCTDFYAMTLTQSRILFVLFSLSVILTVAARDSFIARAVQKKVEKVLFRSSRIFDKSFG